MSHEERSALVSILVNIGVDIFIASKLYGMWQEGLFDSPDALKLWARAVLWAIPLAIGGSIILTILASIGSAIITGDGDSASAADERDRAFQMRGMAVTMVITSIGVVAAFVALALGSTAVSGFTVVFFSMAAGALAGDATRLASYRL